MIKTSLGQQASQVLPPQTGKTISLSSWLCAQGHCHVQAGNGQSQTVNTKLEEHFKI